MKKFLLVSGVVLLSACAQPTVRPAYVQSGPRMCFETRDSFVCNTPVQTWRQEHFPKNNHVRANQMYGSFTPVHHHQSFSRVVYGTW